MYSYCEESYLSAVSLNQNILGSCAWDFLVNLLPTACFTVHMVTVKRRMCELKGWEKVKFCSPAKLTVRTAGTHSNFIRKPRLNVSSVVLAFARKQRLDQKTANAHVFLVLYVNWLCEDVTSSWKLADGAVEFPRYTSKHPLLHPATGASRPVVFLRNFALSLPSCSFFWRRRRCATLATKAGRVLDAPPALSILSRDAWRTETVETGSSPRRTHQGGRMSQCRVGKPDLTAAFLCLLGFLA